MLTALSIRDVVLIERLDLSFDIGLTVLTGETGAGKSILLDSLGLALGMRAESGLVRDGADQATVAAVFAPRAAHPAIALLHEQGIEADDDIVLRRIVSRDGRSRAFINDHPVGAALLKRVGAALVEVQGQHDQMGLADPAMHGPLLDAYAVPPLLRQQTAELFAQWRAASSALARAREAIAAAARDEAWLRHAVDELKTLGAQDGEEEILAAQRHAMQRNERRAEAIAAALSELAPSHGRERRSHAGPAAALRSAGRALQKLAPSTGDADGEAAPALAALERAEEALAEAEELLQRLAQAVEFDPRVLEQSEERLFALRAMARKHDVAVTELPGLHTALATRLAALETGAAEIDMLEKTAEAARAAFAASCGRLTEARQKAAAQLDRAVARELPPLRLDRARFVTTLAPLDDTSWTAQGAENVRFLLATNPGQAPGPLARVASGGELSRLMLALKVVLVSGSLVPTLVFDEVDSGIGGATAAAVGERLARVAEDVQVLVVTHSPQVAARGRWHMRVAKRIGLGDTRAETVVEPLLGPAREEEIARMLAGETVTAAARAAAASLLGAA
jgi:DNA repair protein RecN (Recombination protein N)